MRSRLQPRLVLAPVGFALLAVVLAMAAWSSFGGALPLGADDYTVSVTVPQADNLQTGAAVRSAGVDVGRVVDVERDGRVVRVELAIDGEYAPLRRDARVAVRAKSLIGEAYVQLTLGTGSADAVADRGDLPLAASISTRRLDDVLATFDPRTRGSVRRFVSGLQTAVEDRGIDLSATLGEAQPAALESADLAELVDRQRGALRRLIRDGGAVLNDAGEREGAVRELVRQGNAVLGVTARRSAAVTAIARRLPGFLDELEGASDEVTRAAPDLLATVRALEPVVPRLDPGLGSLQAVLPPARALFADLPPTLTSVRRGAPALTRLLRSLRPALDGLYPALREIIPAVEFAAEDPTFLTATAANLASAANTYVPGPNGSKQRYVRAVPMLWNEIVAGLEQPLPTSRQNQYPRPGSLSTIGRETPRSWSCDHVDNPPAIPVVPPGTGAPPCVTQGPYAYRGRTAYYPRLERAAP